VGKEGKEEGKRERIDGKGRVCLVFVCRRKEREEVVCEDNNTISTRKAEDGRERKA